MEKTEADELHQRVRELSRFAREVGRVHELLDAIDVPRRATPGVTQDDEAYDRILWLIHQGVKDRAMDGLHRKNDFVDQITDKLKKMAEVYSKMNGPDPGTQTQPWSIVRWVKENLK